MLARRAGTEVRAGHEDWRVAELGALEDEVVFVVAPVEEQEFAKARALDALEELLGHDLIGIDVGAVKRCGRAGNADERLHRLLPLSNVGQVPGNRSSGCHLRAH